MAWPFSSVNAPNLDTGPGAAVPATPTVVEAGQAWLMGGYFYNNGGGSLTVTVTNAAGDQVAKATLPPGADKPFEWGLRPSLGLKWSADGVGVLGHLWGYK